MAEDLIAIGNNTKSAAPITDKDIKQLPASEQNLIIDCENSFTRNGVSRATEQSAAASCSPSATSKGTATQSIAAGV